jgi:aminoglycoside phosphotransferase
MRDSQERFAPMTDPHAIAPLLEPRLTDLLGYRADVAEVLDARHKAYRKIESRDKTTLSVCYRLRSSEPASGRTDIVYVKAYRADRSRAAFAALGHEGDSASGRGALHLPDLDMIAWRFPRDPAMPHLAEVMTPERAIRRLPVAARGAAPLEIQVVNYRPEQRCTARLTVPQPGNAPAVTLFAKTFRDGAGATIFRRMRRLHSACSGALHIPAPLAYDAELKTLWLEAIPGVPLVQAMAGGSRGNLACGVARGLAALHRTELPDVPSIGLGGQLAEADKKVAKLSAAYPSHAGPLLDLARALRAAADRLPAPQQALIHGDFHAGQWLAEGEEVALVDFDELAYGDPSQDFASFAVDLRLRASPALAASFCAALRSSYRGHAGSDVHDGWLQWHVLIQLLNKAYRRHLQQPPRVGNEVARLVALIRAEGRALGKSARTKGAQ